MKKLIAGLVLITLAFLLEDCVPVRNDGANGAQTLPAGGSTFAGGGPAGANGVQSASPFVNASFAGAGQNRYAGSWFDPSTHGLAAAAQGVAPPIVAPTGETPATTASPAGDWRPAVQAVATRVERLAAVVCAGNNPRCRGRR